MELGAYLLERMLGQGDFVDNRRNQDHDSDVNLDNFVQRRGAFRDTNSYTLRLQLISTHFLATVDVCKMIIITTILTMLILALKTLAPVSDQVSCIVKLKSQEEFNKEVMMHVIRQYKGLNKKYESFHQELHTLKDINKNLQGVIESLLEEKENVNVQLKRLEIDLPELSLKKIEEALRIYDADKLNLQDFALESAGGYIISTPDTRPYPSTSVYNLMEIFSWQHPSNPRFVIQPGNLPGQCFAFYGQTGRIQLGLSALVDITAITIEHVPTSLVNNVSSALKEFIVYGMDDKMGDVKHELGYFVFAVDKNPLRTFTIDKNDEAKHIFAFVEFKIFSNHGNPNYTSIYRIRVHGKSL